MMAALGGWGGTVADVLARVGVTTVKKAVNSKMKHAIAQAVERKIFPDAVSARRALEELSKKITKEGFPANAIADTARPDRVLVPVGEGGMAVYQVAKNGTAKLQTVLIAR